MIINKAHLNFFFFHLCYFKYSGVRPFFLDLQIQKEFWSNWGHIGVESDPLKRQVGSEFRKNKKKVTLDDCQS